MPCADTSFIFSLYRKDAHSGAAHARLAKAARPLLLSPLNEFELGNALRLAEYQGLLAAGEATRRLEAFAEDFAAGRWLHSDIALKECGRGGAGFKFFSECLNLQLIRAALVAEGTDVLADGDRATHVELICQPAVGRLSRVLKVDGNRDFPGS